jgi:hypothetical protein
MRTHATSPIGEPGLQNRQKTKESLGNIGIFLLLKPGFPHTKFDFLQQLSVFFNGFLIFFNSFPTFFNGFPTFFNGFPIFLNGFPLSKKSKKIYLRWQVYKRSLFELRISTTPLAPQALLKPATIPNNTHHTDLISQSPQRVDTVLNSNKFSTKN